MTDSNWSDELSKEELDQLDALLANPDVWEEPDASDEEAIVAMILSETAKGTTALPITALPSKALPANGTTDESANGAAAANVLSISRARRWLTPALSAAAGLVIALVGVAAFNSFNSGQDEGVVELALEGTDLAPAAEATAKIVDLPAGTRIELDVSQLDAAAPGTYYEVWLRQDAEVGVSAGTFHLRGGDSEIELWAGVSTVDYPLVTITIQEEANPTSSGRVVLKGLLSNND